MTDYALLNQQLASLVHGVPYKIANLSNAAALLYGTLPDLTAAGRAVAESLASTGQASPPKGNFEVVHLEDAYPVERVNGLLNAVTP